jgi:uncharacterized protein YndB with AHSA1/START domain
MTKEKFELEFPVKASASLLYNFISTPSGLADWFAEDVTAEGNVFSFYWGDDPEKAELIKSKKNEFARFKWLEDEDEETYFEFRIQIDELTKDVSLIITDFAEPEEVEEAKMLWESQVHELLHEIGS